MAWLQCRFYSEVLEIDTSLQAIIPEEGEGPWPTLYLLHGLSDDESGWCRMTSIERYARQYQLAVIMPACGRGYYTDMVHGPNWYEFLTQEVPRVAGRLFPLSHERQETFVAGLSMGGYGAFKWALNEPERFAAAASLSGSLDILAVQKRKTVPSDFINIFDDTDPSGTPGDLLALVKHTPLNILELPRLYQWCGTEDHLYGVNVAFRDAARERGIGLDYSEAPGDHDWRYWDEQIARVLAWLPLQKQH